MPVLPLTISYGYVMIGSRPTRELFRLGFKSLSRLFGLNVHARALHLQTSLTASNLPFERQNRLLAGSYIGSLP